MEDWQLWLSIGSIVVGLALILLEVMNPGFFIAVPGTVLLGFGLLSLAAPSVFFDGAVGGWTIAGFFALGTVATIWGYKRWAPPGDRPLTLGNDSLPGRLGTAETPLGPGGGKVRVSGQVFSARCPEPVDVGGKIRVVGVDGLTLDVEKEQAP